MSCFISHLRLWSNSWGQAQLSSEKSRKLRPMSHKNYVHQLDSNHRTLK